MTTYSTDVLSENQLNELQQHEELLENNSLLSSNAATTVNSREFVEKSDEILSSTSKLIISLFEKDSNNEPFTSNGVKSVFQVCNGAGEHVFTIGQCPANQNIQSFVISNSVGHGLMTFTMKGFLNRVCDVDGAGLLSFTQIQHFHGGYTLRDPYKDLVKIRYSWIPFCTCCLQQISSATMTITDLDGSNSGNVVYEKSNSEFDGSTLNLNFIPNLNPKAKFMLLAASIKLILIYFSRTGQKRRNRSLIIFYTIFAIVMLTVCSLLIWLL